MKVFTGNDEWLTTDRIIQSLQEIAKRDAEEGEFHPAEHTCWIASDMIQKLVDIIENKAPEVMLRELADRLETIEFFNKEEWIKKEDA